jgi:GNAT superfamily N-acetyltransferase
VDCLELASCATSDVAKCWHDVVIEERRRAPVTERADHVRIYRIPGCGQAHHLDPGQFVGVFVIPEVVDAMAGAASLRRERMRGAMTAIVAPAVSVPNQRWGCRRLSDGQPGAAGALFVHDGVALFAGATTAPEYRNRGLQSALLHARMQYAHEHDCDLAMMVAEVGSQSQRNAERAGFHIAYTRTKWELRPTASA